MATSLALAKMLSRYSLRTFLTCRSNKNAHLLHNGSRAVSSFQLCIDEYGAPKESLKSRSTEIPSTLGPREVLVKMIMSPVNPSDVNMIEGTYFVKPPLPTVLGNEGVGEIVNKGSGVKGLSVGDWVIPAVAAAGTWQTMRIAPDEELIRIPNEIPVASAATISVNPCSAYRMLKDYVDLKEGDVIIQNGANSGVGISVIQLAKAWGIKTINIVRDRPDLEQLKHYLKSLGADHVVTEDFLRKPEMKTVIEDVGVRPKLAMNCVGGKSATELIRFLNQGGVMVTYGGMSKRPITVPTGPLIFKEIRLFGFWNTLWNQNPNNDFARIEMLADLCQLIKNGQFMPPECEMFPLEDYKIAISQAMEGYRSKKVVFKIE